MVKKYLRGAAYALGEGRRSYVDIADFEAAAELAGLPNLPEVMGFGSFYVTGDVYQCALRSVVKSLEVARLASVDVDQVIFCSSAFKEQTFSERNAKIGKLLRELGIAPQRITGVSGAGCTDVLSAIDIACAILDRGTARNILIVAVEAFHPKNEGDRVISHAIISDAAASLLVSDRSEGAENSSEFEIVTNELVSNVVEIGGGMSIIPSLAHQNFIRTSLGRVDLDASAICKVFGSNIYLPIKSGREGAVGFRYSQMYLENVLRTGHCLGCDSIINLVDFGPGKAGDRHVLYAEAEGHRGCVVLLRAG